jgi:16S rRNA (cytosine1402-N4)-methyltransferase
MSKNIDRKETDKTLHQPVLLKQVLEYLMPKPGESYLDLTAGYGGHASAVVEKTGKPAKAVLVDRDLTAAASLRRRFGNKVKVVHNDFLAASQQLLNRKAAFDMILADLGVSSPHLEDSTRGFSFSHSGKLDMRMDLSQMLTAEQILNSWSESEIARILEIFGEEPKARQIALKIVAARPLTTTDELAAIVSRAWPGKSKRHPATRTFQALRIAVNSELTQLEHSLPLWLDLLNPEGRLVVISFHSLEDRIVKRFFAEFAADTYDNEFTLLTKKPVTASPDEIVYNPRARSARLRAVAKIKNKKKG